MADTDEILNNVAGLGDNHIVVQVHVGDARLNHQVGEGEEELVELRSRHLVGEQQSAERLEGGAAVRLAKVVAADLLAQNAQCGPEALAPLPIQRIKQKLSGKLPLRLPLK